LRGYTMTNSRTLQGIGWATLAACMFALAIALTS
jgi:hypothetical protein